ncbi:HAD family hydrolase [Halobacillus naozhouensis]|uniref:HAD hydrolase-like protein n=1 Tax=Halobacillus naozhouensis TaxID=554880 RepID=A0ABY8J234_9BACI|nr:HAD hydrolase-like protein [Halobacillus naozhouensis]WFT76558.1 HAD hydrolase-like protein [Halobacillus naozhouensis]
MSLRYKCLILDHDDTAVKSTPEIHYPSFVQALKELRPNEKTLTFEEFVGYCFNPGFSSLCKDIIQFTKEEQAHQQKIWKQYTETKIPDFYDNFPETVQEFKKQGGIVTVVSHSERSRIERDYAVHCGFSPDAIFGWELKEHQRKPHAYPINQIITQFDLKETDALVLDDLRPGMMMARSCNIDFAAAGWSHRIPDIKEQMKRESDYYFETVQAFKDFIFNN